jgi:hypothetical protein|tara:strand:- start:68 stop:490 length:423 start_codon:yes stop_codon:yes gene_type:complete
MADGSGTNNKAKASYQSDSYIFTMDSSSASSHTLGMKDSGKTYMLENTVARTITLPAVKAGLKFKFVVTDSTAASTIATSEGTSLIKGGILLATAWETLAGTTLTAATDNVIGDWVELVCDGTYWYISGQSGHANGFTIA